MIQSLFAVFARLFHKKRYLLEARVVIYAYNHHVRLLSPEPVVVKQPKFTRVEEPTLLCNHLRAEGSRRRLTSVIITVICKPGLSAKERSAAWCASPGIAPQRRSSVPKWLNVTYGAT